MHERFRDDVLSPFAFPIAVRILLRIDVLDRLLFRGAFPDLSPRHLGNLFATLRRQLLLVFAEKVKYLLSRPSVIHVYILKTCRHFLSTDTSDFIKLIDNLLEGGIGVIDL